MIKFKLFIKELTKPLFKSELTELELQKKKYKVLEELNKGTITTLYSVNQELHKQIEELNAQIPKESSIDLYCNAKFKKIPNIAYKGKREINTTPYSVYLNEMIQPDSFEVIKFKKGIDMTDNMLYNAVKIGNKVAQWMTWDSDNNLSKSGDYYLTPSEALCRRKGDCIAEYELIITKDGLKSAKEINIGDLVLSYDFNNSEYCWKPIINKWNKGKIPCYRVSFRNGQTIDVTDNHHMAIRNNSYAQKLNKSIYIKKELKDVEIDCSEQSWKRKVPCAIKVPYIPKDIEWLTEELCFVIGHFLAEGSHFNGRSHIETSGHDIIEHILPILDKYKIPYKTRVNNSNCPIAIFLDSWFKEYLNTFTMGCFKLKLPDELLYLPENKLNKIVDGYFLGDGHYHYRGDKQEKIYSTSSDSFAKQLQIIGLRIGMPFYSWLQVHHGGSGNKPIWRLYDASFSEFRRHFGHKDLSETSITSINPIGDIQCYDWEVSDTHIFFFANGIATFQCEDHANIVASISQEFGVAYGFAEGIGWHCFNVFVHQENLHVLDTVEDSAYTSLYDKSDYKINYIVTKDNTYQVNGSVSFGIIAGGQFARRYKSV